MSYNPDVVAQNVERLIQRLNCTNGTQIEELKHIADYDDPVNELPGKHTINNLIKRIPTKTKDYTFEGFVRAYNKMFNTSIKVYDFKETLLPFVSIKTIPDLYEGTYYLYDRWIHDNRLVYGLANFHIVNNQYRVKMCLRIFDSNTLHNEELLQILNDPKSGYKEYTIFMNSLTGEDKRMTYYEGTMELSQDYCVIHLNDCGAEYTHHNQTIFIRKFNYDFREKLCSTIGMKVFNTLNKIAARRLIFSCIELDIHDSFIKNLIYTDDLDITDEQEYSLYKYIKNQLKNG